MPSEDKNEMISWKDVQLEDDPNEVLSQEGDNNNDKYIVTNMDYSSNTHIVSKGTSVSDLSPMMSTKGDRTSDNPPQNTLGKSTEYPSENIAVSHSFNDPAKNIGTPGPHVSTTPNGNIPDPYVSTGSNSNASAQGGALASPTSGANSGTGASAYDGQCP